MRVLHFLPVYVPAWQFGGPVLSVSRLCEGLVRHAANVRVITTTAGLPDFPKEKLGLPQDVNGVQVFYYPVDHSAGTIRSCTLVEALDKHMAWAQVLHLSSIWQPLGLDVQKAAHLAGVPVIQTLRGALGPYSWTRGLHKKVPYFLLKERRLLNRASAIHCTTVQEITEVQWLNLKPPIELLPNPLDLSRLYANADLGHSWRIQNGISTDEPILLIAGRLHHKKGLDLLPSVLKRIQTQQWQLLVIGDDDDGTGLALRRSLEQLSLTSRCHWFSSMPSEKLLGPLNAADLLLLPSRHENFGNIVVEALSCGCGVVLSDNVGVNEMLHGCPGVHTGARTTSQWVPLLQNALTTHRPGKLSEQWVKQRFSQDVIAQQALGMYQRIALNG